jgi:thymidylate kinase
VSGPALAAPTAPLPARLQDLFAAFDAARLGWSLLRPSATLSRAEGDIDVLVDPADLEALRGLLREHGFVVMPIGRPDDVHAADFDPGSDRFLWLHVQTVLRLAGRTVPAADVLAEVRRDPLPRPGDAWLLWILLLHGLLDKGKIAERHRPEILRLAQLEARAAAVPAAGTSSAPKPLAAIATRRGLDVDTVLALARAGDWERLERLQVSGGGGPTPVARVSGAILHARRMWDRRGIAVAVLGPDGAGKTTLVNGLREALPFETQILYMGLTGGRLPRADRLRVPGLVLAARLAILWVRWGVGLYHRLRGRVVVFDRYVLDGTVPSGARLTPLAKVSRRLQASACPRPHVVLLLDASGETMHARSGEYDAATLEHWRTAYRRLRGRVKGLELLDAERPADAVRRDALALVWRLYADRWQAPHG